MINNINGKTDADYAGDVDKVYVLNDGKYDPNKVGTYTVTLAYELDGQKVATMLITKTAEIVITPKEEQPGSSTNPRPIEPNPEPDTKPGTIQPAPEPKPTPTPDTDQNIPKPNKPSTDIPSKSDQNSETVPPKATIESNNQNIISKNSDNGHVALIKMPITKAKSAVIPVKSVVNQNNKQQALPQTGESQHNDSIWAGIAVLISGIVGLFSFKKKESN